MAAGIKTQTGVSKMKTYSEKLAEKRKQWTKENGYYIADLHSGLCMRCVHFSINHNRIETGTCAVLAQEFQEFKKIGISDDSVSTIGICENYMSSYGIGLDNKIIAPQLLPPWFKTRKDKKTGELFVNGIDWSPAKIPEEKTTA
jgi:hypothetical protein